MSYKQVICTVLTVGELKEEVGPSEASYVRDPEFCATLQ